LEATGERLIPEQQGDVAIEHLHRYAIAREFARGKTVLDLASGEGYGAHLMSSVAAQVFGIELCPEAVAHAQSRYHGNNLEFLVGSCTVLPIADDSIDLVVSFETIEHIRDQDEMLDEIRRVLKPDGSLLLSTPDRDVYTAELHRDNPFHVRELNLGELQCLLGQRFRWHRLFRQRLVRGSLVLDESNDESGGRRPGFLTMDGDFSMTSAAPGLADAVYLIALASNAPIDSPAASYFESRTVADDLLKELAMTRAGTSSLQVQLAAAESTIESLSAEAEQLHQIVASRLWRYTSTLRATRRLGTRLASRVAALAGRHLGPPGNAGSIVASRLNGRADRPRRGISPATAAEPRSRIEALELRCTDLEQQLARREEATQHVIKSLNLQKILLIQERDDLARQRLSLMTKCEAAEARLRQLEAQLTGST
jgi:SAM-dependent methyltransferase